MRRNSGCVAAKTRKPVSSFPLPVTISVALVLMSACTDRTPTAPTGVPTISTRITLDTLVIVSAPSVQLRSLASAVAGATSAASVTNLDGQSVAYVSLTPQTGLGGMKAAIRNRRTGDSVVVSMVDGGFDPTPIAAIIDDSLTIDIRDKTSVILAATVRVPKRRPPALVRTDPPKGKTEVPLNSQIAVVFSEPVDPATVARGVQLFNGVTAVAGTVTLSPSGIIAQFSPDLQLAPMTTYELVVDTTVRNLMGEALDSAVHVSFATGSSSGTTGASNTVVASLAVSVLPSSVIVGRPLSFMVTVMDASGNVITDYTGRLHIGSTDPAAQLPPNYTFVGADNGSHIFTVTFGTAGDQSITATDAATSINTRGVLTVVTPVGFVAVNAGVVSSCGLTGGGVAYCWGTNDLGRLGDGTKEDRLSPVPVTGGLPFATLMTASVQTCGLTIDGLAYCWGSDVFASLGIGITAPQTCYSFDWADEGIGNQPCSLSPLPVAGGLRFAALSEGGSSDTCSLTSDGTAYCWGYNREGELGDGTTLYRNAPVAVAGGLHFASVSTGGAHTCGLTTGGIAYCWGDNLYGELGDGTTTSHLVPVPVSGGLRFVALRLGAYHSCGLTTDGAAYCWGRDNYGQVGDEPARDANIPLPVAGGRRFTALTTLSWHTCGLTISGEAYCWGQNSDGQLGDGTTTNQYLPVLVPGGLHFLAVSAGHRHTCGITADGTYCWGANDYGQFGDGTTTSSYVPVRAGGPP